MASETSAVETSGSALVSDSCAPGPRAKSHSRHSHSHAHSRLAPTSVEAHVGRPTLRAGQFRDEVDEDAALLSERLGDFIYSGIPVFLKKQTSRTEIEANTQQINKASTAKCRWLSPGIVAFDTRK